MELTSEQLRRQADEQSLGFASTAEVAQDAGRLRQHRAEHALGFAMDMRFPGYNLYALGAPQIGMHEFVHERLSALAEQRVAADDWCYLNNFEDRAYARCTAHVPASGAAPRPSGNPCVIPRLASRLLGAGHETHHGCPVGFVALSGHYVRLGRT
jgi:hypothetical protein